MIIRATVVLLSIALVWAGQAVAQFPVKPVRLVVPYAAGGPTDLVARFLGEKLSERWKQAVVIDNKPGASGVIGAESVIASVPDGYTLLLHATSGITIYQAMSKKPAFDTLRDLAPISSVVYSPLILVVNQSLPVDDVKGLIEYIKKNSGKISYGSAGPGALNHVGAELFKLRAGVQMLHVPYKGDAPVVADLLNGNLTLSFLSSNLAISQIKGGKLKGLAVTSRTRAEAIPELPTMIEAGVTDFELKAASGILGPKGLSADLLAKINQVVVEVLSRVEVKQRLLESGFTADPTTPEQYADRIRAEIEMWRSVVTRASIPLE
jgi:tripartite-type tricarboxylate transporter receptor subunit TctC